MIQTIEFNAGEEHEATEEQTRQEYIHIDVGETIHAAKMTRQAERHEEAANGYQKMAMKRTVVAKQAKCADKKAGIKNMALMLRQPTRSSITFLKEKVPEGQATKYTTDPMRIDQLVRDEWSKVYDGNQEDNVALADTFMKEYGDCIDQGDECQVPDIDGDDVWYAFTHAKASAAGLDSWEPAEIKLFSRSACHYVARLYNMIERGCAWPVSATVAKAAFLP